jgi:DTW domain-containing protein
MITPLKIILLTHERELHRPTNTGTLALALAGDLIERMVWERINPNARLLELLSKPEALLLYPADAIESKADLHAQHRPEHNSSHLTLANANTIIVIDGTWQEAQKIYNKSAYLKKAPKATLTNTTLSTFSLRRNQVEGGLCTIECIIELCNIKGLHELADTLTAAFEQFNRR